ncbi:hypothetical protein NMY22_g11009 [Coprinellus aureogranulatus]|nr:hypothetical protein NMY22_g11009 [Coprinellus aureogranulatus]
MAFRKLCSVLFVLGLFAPTVLGHIAAWNKGMYCLNGTRPGVNDLDTTDAVPPLWQCDEFPPAEGDFLELPAGGSFIVELAVNRAFTSLSYDVHTQNEAMAAGTAFAISYESDITKVTPENLVVFTVLYKYVQLEAPLWICARVIHVVDAFPAVPLGIALQNTESQCSRRAQKEGVIACLTLRFGVNRSSLPSTHGRCGEPNMYMQPFKCKVVGQTGSRALASGVPPQWCEDDQSKCVAGPKQMVYWNQLEGNNVFVSGVDLSGRARAPAYNNKMGFANGAQPDIFLDDGSATPTFVAPGPSDTPPKYALPTGTARGSSGSESWRLGGSNSCALSLWASIWISVVAGFSLHHHHLNFVVPSHLTDMSEGNSDAPSAGGVEISRDTFIDADEVEFIAATKTDQMYLGTGDETGEAEFVPVPDSIKKSGVIPDGEVNDEMIKAMKEATMSPENLCIVPIAVWKEKQELVAAFIAKVMGERGEIESIQELADAFFQA